MILPGTARTTRDDAPRSERTGRLNRLPNEPTRRAVVLGASNVARNLAIVFDTTRRLWREPVELLVAAGHGRSYGLSTRVLGRGLSSLGACNLWRELDRRRRLPTAALVTDVGNDLMYGVPVDVVLTWVERCLNRLAEAGATLVATGLPTASVSRVNPWLYYPLRTVLFPRNRDPLATIVARARRLDDGLRALADRYGARFVEPRPEWYGLDPIHLRARCAGRAWREILAAWSAPTVAAPTAANEVAVSWSRRWTSLRWIADERRWFGIVQRRPQPVAMHADGTTLSMY